MEELPVLRTNSIANIGIPQPQSSIIQKKYYNIKALSKMIKNDEPRSALLRSVSGKYNL